MAPSCKTLLNRKYPNGGIFYRMYNNLCSQNDEIFEPVMTENNEIYLLEITGTLSFLVALSKVCSMK